MPESGYAMEDYLSGARWAHPHADPESDAAALAALLATEEPEWEEAAARWALGGVYGQVARPRRNPWTGRSF